MTRLNTCWAMEEKRKDKIRGSVIYSEEETMQRRKVRA